MLSLIRVLRVDMNKRKILPFIIVLLVSFNVFALSSKSKITSIHVQHNRTWIDIDTSLGDQTTCSNKFSIEVANTLQNRESILSAAYMAMATDMDVQWVTSSNCSNVNRDIVGGIKIVKS